MSICVGEEKIVPQKRDLGLNHRAPLDESFELICQDEHLYTAFEQFLITQFSQENLHFYSEVVKFHALTDAAEIASTAERLCKSYFGYDGSEVVLNVNSFTTQQILKSLSHPTTTMFDMAYHDVEQILKTLYITFIGEPAPAPKPKKSGGFGLCVDVEPE